MSKTYYIEYGCTKAREKYHGFLEIDSKEFPSERKIRKILTQTAKLTRVQNLRYMAYGASK